MKIEISELSKSFILEKERRQIFQKLSFSVNFPHVLALLGSSGSGKTSLLRILAGLEYPDSGTIWIDDEEIKFSRKFLQNYRKTHGMVFQNFNLFPHYTALKNILLPLIVVHGYRAKDANIRAEEVIERLQLLEHRNKKPYQLSGGQRQRVAIARALAIQPKFLLFDEPTSSLDPEMTAEVLDLIAELKSTATPIILVTHEISFAKKIADQVLFLADGKIIEQGCAKNFFSHPETEQAKKFLAKVLR